MSVLTAIVLPWEDEKEPHPPLESLCPADILTMPGRKPDYEDMVQERLGERSMLLYSKRLHNSGPVNCNFEKIVREAVPHAPKFCGVLIYISEEPVWDPCIFVDHCRAKWENAPEKNAEEAQRLLHFLSSTLYKKPE